MQVITLNPEEFDKQASRLAREVEDRSRTPYDAIVGVKRGGSIVCDAFLLHFDRNHYGERFDVELQRPSTKHKKGPAGSILKRLPYPILDVMRKGEAVLLGLIKKSKGTTPPPDVEIPNGLAEILTIKTNPRILVIDDAIDSGDTLFAIVETLKKTNPDVTVKTAVITETTRQPRIRADYTLYRNRTLIRFPWSNDYKEN